MPDDNSAIFITSLFKSDRLLEQYSILSVLWYAFASDCYLDSVNGDQLDIPFIPTSRNRYDFDYKYTASYTRYPDMPQLPVEVYFQSPGEIKYWLSESDALSKPPLHRKRPPPFDKGYTVSSYRASNFRRVGNVWIPGMADYKVFAQLLLQGDKPLPNGENLFMAQHFKFRLEGAETSSIESHFPPSPPNDAFRVIDLRFVAETPPIVGLLYDSTNAWPTLDEARQLPQFKILDEVRNSLQTLPTKARLRKSSRRWVIAVVFLVSTASIILLSRLSTKK